MAKLPDASAFGDLGAGVSGRPIAQMDVSGYARGAAAEAAGMEKLGEGIGTLGKGVAIYAKHDQAEQEKLRKEDDALEMARAQSDFLTNKVQLDSQYKDDNDFATLPTRYKTDLDKIHSTAAQQITNPRNRELFTLKTSDDVARGVAGADLQANKSWKDATLADGNQRLETIRTKALESKDPVERQRLIDTGTEVITSLADKNIISQNQAVETRKKWSIDYATASVQMLPAAEQVKVLGGFKATLINRESSGRPGLVNQFGYAGLIQMGAPRAADIGIYTPGAGEDMKNWSTTGKDAPGKWSGTFNIPGHPEIRTLADYLKSTDAQDTTLDIHTKKMDQEIKANGLEKFIGQTVAGVPITRDGLYAMMHLGGVGGAKSALESGGAKNAADANGATVLEYARLGLQSDMARVAKLLPPDTQQKLLRQAEATVHRDQVAVRTSFTRGLADDLTEAQRTGTVAKPKTPEDFERVLGPEDGKQAYEEYNTGIQLGADVQTIANMSPGEVNALRRKYQPQPGEGYADQAKRVDMLEKAIAESNKQRDADPAQFAISRLPAANGSYKTFSSVLADRQAGGDTRREAARDFAATTMYEQTRIGVAPDAVRIMPDGYIDNLLLTLQQPEGIAKTDGTKGTPIDAAKVLKAEADLWGEYWPLVSRDLQGKATIPIVRVMAAGVTDRAAMVLPSLIKTPLNEILKGHGDEDIRVLKKDVDAKMKTLAVSMMGTREQAAIFNDYVAAGEKLAAHYVLNGKTSSEAADLAYHDLLGHKYEFVESGSYGTMRIPKDAGVPVAKITLGASEARKNLEWLDLAPATDQTGALGPRAAVPLPKAGLVEAGNINLNTRPTVKNPDGSISTVRSIGVNIDGKETLLPTVSDDGRNLSEQEAVDLYKRTGKHLGKFDTPHNATAFAKALHDQQAQQYGRASAGPSELEISAGAPANVNAFGDRALAAAGAPYSSESYLERASVSGIRRDAQWATAAGDTGLWLVLGNRVVTRSDGSKIILTWKDLGGFADAYENRRKANMKPLQEFTGMPRG